MSISVLQKKKKEYIEKSLLHAFLIILNGF